MPTARSALLLASALLVSPVRGKACEGSDLPADGELRIGRKYKPEVCEKLSKSGDYLRIHYTATTYSDCTLIDESYYEGVEFSLGKGEMIQAWDQGLGSMCVFEKRKLTVPANLAYGSGGSLRPLIPPNATLIFEIELVGLNGKAPKKQKGRQPGWGKKSMAPKGHPRRKLSEEEMRQKRSRMGMGMMGGMMGGMGGGMGGGMDDDVEDTPAHHKGHGMPKHTQRHPDAMLDATPEEDAADPAPDVAEEDAESPKDEV